MKKIKFEDTIWISNSDNTIFENRIGDYKLTVSKYSRSNWDYQVVFKTEVVERSKKPTTTYLRAIGVCEGIYLNHSK